MPNGVNALIVAWGVSLHFASSSNEFSGHLIFADEKKYVIKCLLEIRLQLYIKDAETSSNFYAADYSQWTCHPRIYNVVKTHFGSSPSVVKHHPDLLGHR